MWDNLNPYRPLWHYNYYSAQYDDTPHRRRDEKTPTSIRDQMPTTIIFTHTTSYRESHTQIIELMQ